LISELATNIHARATIAAVADWAPKFIFQKYPNSEHAKQLQKILLKSEVK
jgi:hypothetical protein